MIPDGSSAGVTGERARVNRTNRRLRDAGQIDERLATRNGHARLTASPSPFSTDICPSEHRAAGSVSLPHSSPQLSPNVWVGTGEVKGVRIPPVSG